VSTVFASTDEVLRDTRSTIAAGASPAPVLLGTATSPGTGRGRARLVATLDEARAARPGRVLVFESLPAEWVALLPAPAAVVVGRGGALSNAAIVLRERGVPAVMVPEALHELHDGDPVEVDGAVGLVRVGA
jgi:pyruvate,water dikinase